MMYDKNTLIERINYTASLVTSMSEVDAYLDRLRAITSLSDFSPEHMSDQQYATLCALQQQLETYLVEREPLRSFTAESLQIQIGQHLAGNRGAQQGLREIGVILVIAAITVAVLAVLPLSAESQQRFVFMGAVAAGIMNLGGAWLFMSALSSFKSQLRQAFMLICLGIMSFALAILLQPFIEFLHLRATSDIEVFFVMPLILLAAVFIYLGSARYAKLVTVKSWFLSLKTLLLTGVLMSLIIIVPHHAHGANDSALTLGISAALHAGVVLFALATIVLLIKIIPRIADLYKPPVRSLLQAIIFMLVVVLFVTGTVANSGPRLSSSMALFAFVILLLMGGMLMRAGYAFKKVSRY